jgi:hypothetical protein
VRVPTGLLPTGRYTLSIASATYRGEKVFAAKGHNVVTLTVRRPKPAAAPGDDAAPQAEIDDSKKTKKQRREEAVPLLQPALEWEVVVLADAPAEAVAP